MIVEIDKISHDITPHPEEGEEQVVIQDITSDYYQNVDKEIGYIVKEHFTRIDPKDIDFAYIETIAPHFEEYIDVVESLVNTYATTFKFTDMDIMDRVIFVL